MATLDLTNATPFVPTSVNLTVTQGSLSAKASVTVTYAPVEPTFDFALTSAWTVDDTIVIAATNVAGPNTAHSDVSVVYDCKTEFDTTCTDGSADAQGFTLTGSSTGTYIITAVATDSFTSLTTTKTQEVTITAAQLIASISTGLSGPAPFGSDVTFTARVSGPAQGPFSYHWTCTDLGLTGSDETFVLTPAEISSATSAAVVLRVTETPSGIRSDTELSIDILQPPRQGSITISPPLGAAGITEFVVSAVDFEAATISDLFYSIFVNGKTMVSDTLASESTIRLPSGTNVISVVVSDRYGSSVSDDTTVEVFELSASSWVELIRDIYVAQASLDNANDYATLIASALTNVESSSDAMPLIFEMAERVTVECPVLPEIVKLSIAKLSAQDGELVSTLIAATAGLSAASEENLRDRITSLDTLMDLMPLPNHPSISEARSAARDLVAAFAAATNLYPNEPISVDSASIQAGLIRLFASGLGNRRTTNALTATLAGVDISITQTASTTQLNTAVVDISAVALPANRFVLPQAGSGVGSAIAVGLSDGSAGVTSFTGLNVVVKYNISTSDATDLASDSCASCVVSCATVVDDVWTRAAALDVDGNVACRAVANSYVVPMVGYCDPADPSCLCGNSVVDADEDCDGVSGCQDCQALPGYKCSKNVCTAVKASSCLLVASSSLQECSSCNSLYPNYCATCTLPYVNVVSGCVLASKTTQTVACSNSCTSDALLLPNSVEVGLEMAADSTSGSPSIQISLVKDVASLVALPDTVESTGVVLKLTGANSDGLTEPLVADAVVKIKDDSEALTSASVLQLVDGDWTEVAFDSTSTSALVRGVLILLLSFFFGTQKAVRQKIG